LKGPERRGFIISFEMSKGLSGKDGWEVVTHRKKKKGAAAAAAKKPNRPGQRKRKMMSKQVRDQEMAIQEKLLAERKPTDAVPPQIEVKVPVVVESKNPKGAEVAVVAAFRTRYFANMALYNGTEAPRLGTNFHRRDPRAGFQYGSENAQFDAIFKVWRMMTFNEGNATLYCSNNKEEWRFCDGLHCDCI